MAKRKVSPTKNAKVTQIIREVRTTGGTLVCFVAKCDTGAIRVGFFGRFSTSNLDSYHYCAEQARNLCEELFIQMCINVINDAFDNPGKTQTGTA